MSVTHPLAGELAEDGGDVACVLSHHFTDIFLHAGRNATRQARDDVLEFQQGQRGVPEGLHQGRHPLFQLQTSTCASE